MYARPEGELRRAGWAFTLSPMRDRETIDSELRLLAAVPHRPVTASAGLAAGRPVLRSVGRDARRRAV